MHIGIQGIGTYVPKKTCPFKTISKYTAIIGFRLRSTVTYASTQ